MSDECVRDFSFPIAVVVSVMKIRPVVVVVFNRPVIVRVCVGHRVQCVVVFVAMMTIVMPVPVLVRHAVVPVDVAVFLTEEYQ